MFIASALYSYFFLISSKICLMGMQPATSCPAPAPVCPGSALAAVRPTKTRAVQFAFLSVATFDSLKCSVCKAF